MSDRTTKPMFAEAIRWIKWNPRSNRWRPPQRRYVLLATAGSGHRPPAVAVGWLKYHAGVRSEPYFVIPALGELGGSVTHYADCLGDTFQAPHWRGRQTQ